jgi:hypothetical protein
MSSLLGTSFLLRVVGHYFFCFWGALITLNGNLLLAHSQIVFQIPQWTTFNLKYNCWVYIQNHLQNPLQGELTMWRWMEIGTKDCTRHVVLVVVSLSSFSYGKTQQKKKGKESKVKVPFSSLYHSNLWAPKNPNLTTRILNLKPCDFFYN